ncbi:NAD-dependent epimerase/dehydratase family protein [Cystobacter fuscus]
MIGTMNVLSAVGRARVPRLIVPSLTALYGARASHPALLSEETPLTGCPGSRFINDKVEVEKQVRVFRERHPETRVIVLRFAPMFGPNMDNPRRACSPTAWCPRCSGTIRSGRRCTRRTPGARCTRR